MKSRGPIILAFVVGMLMMIQFFTPNPFFLRLYNIVLDWKQVVLGCTFILGTWSLVRYHVKKIQRRQENWQYSYVTLAGLTVTVGSALIWKTVTGPYPWLFNNIQVPMQSTMFSLLAFFVASASYRAFRARTVHATLLLVAGALVMLGRVPIGAYFSGSVLGVKISLVEMSDWLLNVPNLAAKRGIMMGVGLGMTATAIKIILGIEKTYLGRSD
ncbi:MAG: hypothetical protein ABIJ00_15570 [Candidatus Eisenbacteria bacterium]